MFFDKKQKVLLGCSIALLTFAAASTVAYVNRKPDVSKMPEDVQAVVPLKNPLETDDAGVSEAPQCCCSDAEAPDHLAHSDMCL